MNLSPRTVTPLCLACTIARPPALDLRAAWAKTRGAVAAAGLVGPSSVFGAFFETASLTPTAFAWYAAAMSLQPDQVAPEGLEELLIAGGDYLTTTYQGGFEGLGAAWGAFTKEVLLLKVRLDLARPCFELYGSPSGASPAEARTDLYIPIA